MPGAFSHLVFSERLRTDPTAAQFTGDLSADAVAMDFGAMGPDFLYFHPADWAVIGPALEEVYKLYDCLKDYVALYERLSVVNSDVLNWVTGGVSRELRNTANSLMTVVRGLVAKYVTGKLDLFEVVTPPMHHCVTSDLRKAWWWIDLGHHVRTSDFLRELWSNAQTASTKAYVFGYASHMAADVIGHAYVNTICGGPYRDHWRRHVLIEKCLDTHLWGLEYNQEVFASGGHERIVFARDERLPDEISNLIKNALNSVYKGFRDPITDDDMGFMYTGFHEWMEASSTQSLLSLTDPPDFDWFDLDDFVRDRLDELNDSRPDIKWPHGPITLDAIKKLILSIIGFAAWLAEYAVTILTLPLATLVRLSTTELRYLLWLAQKALYESYGSIRLALSHGAYLHPERSMLQPYFSRIVFPTSQDWGQMREIYPFQRYYNSRQTYHLVHPSGYDVNYRGVFAQRQPPSTDAFIHRGSPPDVDALFRCSSDSTVAAAFFDASAQGNSVYDFVRKLRNDPPTQSATAGDLYVELTRRLTSGSLNDIPNWNLDADRGFGWPAWATKLEESAWTDGSFDGLGAPNSDRAPTKNPQVQCK